MSGLPPGPSEPPIVQTLCWLARPVSFMESCRRRYGDAFTVRFVGFERPTVFLSDPAVIRALYSEQSNGLPRGRTVALRPILGADSVLLLEGPDHIARRRLMLPPFHGERMRSYQSIVEQVTRSEIERWPVGERFPLHPRMQAITLEVILRAVFGVVDEQRRERLRQRLPLLLSESSSIWLQLRVLLSARLGRADPRARTEQLMAEIDELLLAEIAERRTDPDLHAREDVLSLLIGARFEDGTQMSDRELRDQLLTLLLAGHETTATALAWTVDLLLRNEGPLRRLQRELDAAGATGAERAAGPEGATGTEGLAGLAGAAGLVGAAGGAGLAGAAGAEGLAGPEGAAGPEGEYLRATVTEALRLRPVVPLAGRRLTHDMEADGIRLPAGTDVTPAIWLTHTRPDLYPDPYEFRPERFLDRPPATYGWIPFGGGIRRCLGAAFAEMEARTVLQTMLTSLTLHPGSRGPEAIMRRNVTLSPRRGTVVRVAPRLRAAGRAPEALVA
jgi:cytochrome P450 family 135